MNPKELKYSRGHTWAKVEGNIATIGVTDHAQHQLGSVLFVELKQPGETVAQFEPCGSVESDKATADVMSPLSGKVTEINEEAVNAPEVLNKDAYGEGWLLKLELSNPGEVANLMSADQFEAFTANA
ncbi:MAG: glycine cleavage system protein GcvH [Chloroflexi bacterium]|nr:glycine cleavage system protein GcvH [Chloroflexota bacterium]